ncbi:MAG: hypothetical protein ABR520_04820 [Mycobacteriales bacterium]|nr:hypothetical protein [Frankia sp.]
MNPNLERLRGGFGKFGGRTSILVIALGLLAIALGWNGAAGVPNFIAQLPYLLSGGFLGLALVTIGAAMMVVQGAREDRARLEAKLEQVIEAMGGSGGSRAPEDLHGLVVAGSASYHVPGCRLVDGREEVSYLTPEEARAKSLQPCRVCQPDPSNVTVR